MALTLRTRSNLKSEDARFSALVTYSDVPDIERRADYVRVIDATGAVFEGDSLRGYAGIIVH